jgi:3-oxoacyl-[acyl-carrier-protein] synthase II
MSRRVAITGYGGVTGLGSDWETIEANLLAGRNCVQKMPEWDLFANMNTRLAAPVSSFVVPESWPRKNTRSMGRVALLSVRASELALQSAGLLGEANIKDGRMGVAYGSSFGSMEPIRLCGNALQTGSIKGITSTSYLQAMGHTTPVNIALHFELKGRIIPTSSACSSASHAIGYSFEAIRSGRQALMLAGGGEELTPAHALIFDTLFATSTRNDTPAVTPSPFDRARDGLVVGEGACTLVLEDFEHALARGAPILAEIIGYGSNSDGAHATQPTAATMAVCIRQSLKDAGLAPSDIPYVSAHGTGTDRGDIAESQATNDVFGEKAAISSMKSYLGHTLGACGSIEAWWAIEMMRRGWFAPTLNLREPDPACSPLDHIIGEPRHIETEHVLSNNFAFGGINTSLVFRRHRS